MDLSNWSKWFINFEKKILKLLKILNLRYLLNIDLPPHPRKKCKRIFQFPQKFWSFTVVDKLEFEVGHCSLSLSLAFWSVSWLVVFAFWYVNYMEAVQLRTVRFYPWLYQATGYEYTILSSWNIKHKVAHLNTLMTINLSICQTFFH